MRKKILVITLTVLVFLSCVLLGGATVFRINEITVKTSAISPPAQAEAQALKTRLEEEYLGENLLFADRAKAETVVEEFPYFLLVSFKKELPSRLVVTVLEDAEVYAVPHSDQSRYYLLSANGSVLSSREDGNNRLDGYPNVLLGGLTVTANGTQLSGDDYFQTVLNACQGFDKKLGGIRNNVLSVNLISRQPVTMLTFQMYEGVRIYLVNPNALTQEKIEGAIEKYFSLSVEQRRYGCIVVSDIDGQAVISYEEKDTFQP